MIRQSITLSEPNNEWLNSLVESEEYSSKSEVVNELIRKARKVDEIRAKLIAAEQSGYSTLTMEEIRKEAIERLKRDGEL